MNQNNYIYLLIILIIIILFYEYNVHILILYIKDNIIYNILDFEVPNTNILDKTAINKTLENASEEHKIGSGIIGDNIKTYIWNNYKLSYVIEFQIINITRTNLIFILDIHNYIRIIEKQESDILEKYISFTRFSRGTDKMSCDWCSIVNGSLELLLDTVYANINDKSVYKLLNSDFQIELNKLIYINNIFYHIKPKQHDLDKYYDKIDLKINNENKEQIKKLVYNLVIFRDIVEDIETRWCPFKHMTKLNFDREYYKYNPNDVKELKIASNIIKNQGEIKCDQCIKLLNESPVLNKHSHTIFKDYMKRINQILTI
jgi:hypothetical protein